MAFNSPSWLTDPKGSICCSTIFKSICLLLASMFRLLNTYRVQARYSFPKLFEGFAWVLLVIFLIRLFLIVHLTLSMQALIPSFFVHLRGSEYHWHGEHSVPSPNFYSWGSGELSSWFTIKFVVPPTGMEINDIVPLTIIHFQDKMVCDLKRNPQGVVFPCVWNPAPS